MKANMESKRTFDENGWFEIRDNPISKSGVFEYSGAQISPELEPDKIYKVYRPESALNNEDTINSFKLLPWIDGHMMLGAGNTPAEETGVQGVTGQSIYFKEGRLFANIKLFSEKMRDLIDRGIKELSCGFRCKYRIRSGIAPSGEQYDVEQTDIRGNHLALVPEGRVGSDVCVMDSYQFAFDQKGAIKMEDKDKKTDETPAKDESGSMTLEQMSEMLGQLAPLLGMVEEIKSKLLGGGEVETEEVVDEDAEEEPEIVEEAEDMEDKDKENDAMDAKFASMKADYDKQIKELKKAAMDEAANVKRDALACDLTGFVGTFDHSKKTIREVAKYGVEKMGIACDSGEEVIALKTYMKNFKPETFVAQAEDSVLSKADDVVKKLNGEA